MAMQNLSNKSSPGLKAQPSKRQLSRKNTPDRVTKVTPSMMMSSPNIFNSVVTPPPESPRSTNPGPPLTPRSNASKTLLTDAELEIIEKIWTKKFNDPATQTNDWDKLLEIWKELIHDQKFFRSVALKDDDNFEDFPPLLKDKISNEGINSTQFKLLITQWKRKRNDHIDELLKFVHNRSYELWDKIRNILIQNEKYPEEKLRAPNIQSNHGYIGNQNDILDAFIKVYEEKRKTIKDGEEERDKLEEEIKTLKDNISKLEALLKAALDKDKELDKQLSDSNSKLKEYQEKHVNCEQIHTELLILREKHENCAKTIQELDAKLKDFVDNHQDCERTRKKLEKLRVKHQNCTRIIEELNTKLRNTNSESEDLKKITATGAQAKDMDEKLSKLQDQYDNLLSEFSKDEESIKELRNENLFLQLSNENLKRDIENEKNKSEAGKKSYENQIKEQKSRELTQLKNSLVAQENEQKILKDRNSKLELDIKKLKDTNAGLGAKISDLEAQSKSTEEDHRDQLDLLKKLYNSKSPTDPSVVDSTKQAGDLNREIIELKKTKEQIKKETIELSTQKEQLNNQYNQMRQSYDIFIKEYEKERTQKQELKREMEINIQQFQTVYDESAKHFTQFNQQFQQEMASRHEQIQETERLLINSKQELDAYETHIFNKRQEFELLSQKFTENYQFHQNLQNSIDESTKLLQKKRNSLNDLNEKIEESRELLDSTHQQFQMATSSFEKERNEQEFQRKLNQGLEEINRYKQDLEQTRKKNEEQTYLIGNLQIELNRKRKELDEDKRLFEESKKEFTLKHLEYENLIENWKKENNNSKNNGQLVSSTPVRRVKELRLTTKHTNDSPQQSLNMSDIPINQKELLTLAIIGMMTLVYSSIGLLETLLA